jgi:aldehyde dehydrogenase (NAD+)
MDLKVFSNDLDQVYTRLRNGLLHNSRDYNWRIGQLNALKKLLIENEAALNQAMWQDMHKSSFECQATEQGVVLAEIENALQNLKRWMKPKKAMTPLYNQLGHSYIVYEALGLTLILGAWNYPINLTLAPLVAAIAGGNAAIIKPSEISAHTAQALGELLPKYLDANLFAVIQGGSEQTDVLLDKQFDLIFFTGSGQVGKIILKKAAPHLTPSVLELGGKSPAVIFPDADLKVSARRIAWGKFMNAGQTCVAPDYVIAHSAIREEFVAELKLSLTEFYGADVKSNPDYCRIINSKNFDRLAQLLKGEVLVHGGQTDREQLFIEPTLVSSTGASPSMQEEIFGPILPILEMDDLKKITEFINARPKPLALYVFTKKTETVEAFTADTSSGAICVNDVVMHMPVPSLPFGGIGSSGMGNYHGEFGFKTFTHAKGILRKSFLFDVPVRYPPYSIRKAKVLRWLFK